MIKTPENRPYPVLMNKNSGTMLRLGEEKVTALIRERLGGLVSDIHLTEGADMPAMIDRLAGENPHGLIMGGGDGTAVCAAEQLKGRDIPFAMLPLGTMNLLARDLGSAQTLEETMARFEGFVDDRIDYGLVNGRIFLCAAVVGFVPEGAVVREELREAPSLGTLTQFLTLIANGIAGKTRHQLYLKSCPEDKPYEINTTALVISNNGYEQNTKEIGGSFLRSNLKGGKLAVYSAAPRDMMDGLKMALSMWQGEWQDHESIRSFETSGLIVESREANMQVSIDGEPQEMQSPLTFTIERQAIPVLRTQLAEAA